MRKTVLLLASVFLAVLLASTVSAAAPAEGGKIVYEGYDGDDYEIYAVDPSGGTPTPLTNDGVNEIMPTLSPDGKRVVYAGRDAPTSQPGNYDIYTVSVLGGEPTNVTDTSTQDENNPDYAPDGSRIAYNTGGGPGAEIYTIAAAGGEPTRLTNNVVYDTQPDYSPDGLTIAYTSGVDDIEPNVVSNQVFTIPSSGGTPTQLTHDSRAAQDPDYSPDGSKVAYTGWPNEEARIYTIPASGGTATEVTVGSSPDYSPDGSRIVYFTQSDLYTISSSGGTPFQITDNIWAERPNWGSFDDTPPDTDGDGVNDSEDQCPDEAGPASNNGCPLPLPPPPDTIAPSGEVLINGGAQRTTTRTVKLTLDATDPSPGSGIETMRIKNAGGNWTAWQSYAESKDWTLTRGTGKKTVYVQYKDGVGNVSAKGSDSITYRP